MYVIFVVFFPHKYGSSHRRCSVIKSVFRNFAKLPGKHLCHSLFFNKDSGLRPETLLKKRLWHRCYPVNFAKFLRTPFLRNTSRRLLLWFKSYLTDRKQSVLINSFNSNVSTIMSGIPPGSVLGSLVFLIYINDLNIAIKNCKVHYLADNTNLLNIKKLR